jgi:ribosomal protein L29
LLAEINTLKTEVANLKTENSTQQTEIDNVIAAS